ncbi:hypothetical protein MTO96_033860 [Rhipicephalus appendiculatus]
MRLRGCFVGDSQLKFLNSSRLHLGQNCDTCTFSYGGAKAARVMEAMELLRPGLHFLVIYVGGNDLSTRQSADEIADGIKDRFLAGKNPKPPFYAVDGYHISRGQGVKALAKAASLAVRGTFRDQWSPCGQRAPAQIWEILKCGSCKAKGHSQHQCRSFLQNPYQSQ